MKGLDFKKWKGAASLSRFLPGSSQFFCFKEKLILPEKENLSKNIHEN